MKIKYRIWGKGLPPQKIKLQIPGWAGSDGEYKNGAKPQPWHCKPFVDGSKYGLELIYPFDAECKIINDGKLRFEGNFEKECVWSQEPTPPFSAFAPGHYGFTSCLDLMVPDDFVLRLEPHPRFFTDTIGDCPIAVPGHLESWWCKIFFVVFKAPRLGETHIFRKNEPYAKILVVPKNYNYELEQMSNEESLERAKIELNIGKFKNKIYKKSWKDNQGNMFDDKYKQLSKIYEKKGLDGIKELFVENKEKKKTKLIGRFINEALQNKKE